MARGVLAGLLIGLLIIAVIWTDIVLREDRAWRRKAPAVFCGLAVIGLLLAGKR